MIKVKNLHKYYNKGKKSEQHVLSDINVEFGNTGLICILGESGSGKTTLLNTIGGLDDWASGTIEIEGTSLKGYKQKTIEPIRNDHFGYIFQNYYLLKDYTVSYNVKLALNRYDISEKEKEERTNYILNLLGILKYKNKPVSKLSGGQQQRVSIARALVKAPDIILADEPTGNLDEENTIRTMTILKSISKECLVLLVTHERRIADFFGDRTIEICDGEIIRDTTNISSSYERSDDTNIYLKELDTQKIENDFAKFQIYHKKNQPPDIINLNIVWKDNKLYIQNNTSYDILLEGEENGIQILDKERPTLNMDEIDDFSYDLSKLPSKGNAHLPFNEIWRIASANIKLMGKKQTFIIIIMLAAAIMLSITTAKTVNMKSINEENIVSSDSHYLQVDFNNVSVFSTEDQYRILEYTWNNLDDTKGNGDTFYIPNTTLYLAGQGFVQFDDLKQAITNYSFVDLKHLDSSKMLYGKMPEKRNEIAVDIRVIKTLMKSDGVVSSDYKTPDAYIGAIFRTRKESDKLYISGICDTNEPAIYCSQNAILPFAQRGYSIANVDELKAYDEKTYANVSLKDDEILIRETLYKSMLMDKDSSKNSYVIGDDWQHPYKVVGTFYDDIGVDFVLSNRGCLNVRDLMIYDARSCVIYTDDINATKKYLNGIENTGMTAFKLKTSVPRTEEIKAYIKSVQTDSDASNLITIAIVIISVLMVYFTIKSNAMSRSEELTVYSLLGISKNSILKAYMLEMIILTSRTSLPAVIITSGVIKFIGNIPSLQIGMLFPWWSVLILLAVIYAVHIFISILPVYSILSKPPATLAIKG